jgi:hypothetical protein
MTFCNPLMRSQERLFILCGMAEEPTWPLAKPSPASSCPAMRRKVLAKLDGAAGKLAQRDDLEVETAWIDLPDIGENFRSIPRCRSDAAFQLDGFAGVSVEET